MIRGWLTVLMTTTLCFSALSCLAAWRYRSSGQADRDDRARQRAALRQDYLSHIYVQDGQLVPYGVNANGQQLYWKMDSAPIVPPRIPSFR